MLLNTNTINHSFGDINNQLTSVLNESFEATLSGKCYETMKRENAKKNDYKFHLFGKDSLTGGCPYCGKTIAVIPEIKEVETYNERVVLVRFVDGTWTKAALSENDLFDIDVGITICMIKRILGGQKDGTKLYNNYIRAVHKKMKENEKAKKEAEEERKRICRKRVKAIMKRKAKALKAKEDMIDIVKHGMERALQERDR